MVENMLLKDKVAIVTGAAQGIGKAIAVALAREGANIVIVDINLEGAKATAREIESLGRGALVFEVDVSRADQVNEMVKKVLDSFKRIDILINNAGITRDALIVRMDESDWDKVMEINLKSAFNCSKAVARPMMKQRSGKIINIASVIGLVGNVGQSNYAASKAGIIGLAKSLAKELAPRGINVNAIAPGFIKTEMTERLSQEVRAEMLKRIPLARFGDVEDVARVVLFLVSDAAGYITGQVLNVDGGMIM
ncbi:3-oxoacyl-[acyl-carrier-protein] reductase [candidate division NPL-UPA2 bacterium]|nr:3-oxoacyl-[acyl-carrier-protein] reductase [candidate division NPL-UPA2 bacterium]